MILHPHPASSTLPGGWHGNMLAARNTGRVYLILFTSNIITKASKCLNVFYSLKKKENNQL